MAKKTQKFEWNGVPCVFGTAGSGKKKVRLGVHICHNSMDDGSAKLSYAEYRKQFVMKQLEVCIACDPSARRDTPGQGTLMDMSKSITAIADVTSFKYGQDGIGFSLAFTRGTVDLNTLGEFVGMGGKMSWTIKGAIESPKADAGEDDEDDEEEEDVP